MDETYLGMIFRTMGTCGKKFSSRSKTVKIGCSQRPFLISSGDFLLNPAQNKDKY